MSGWFEGKLSALPLLTVMPAGVSGHPVFGVKMLDSRVQRSARTLCHPWRENDGTSFKGPHVYGSGGTSSFNVWKIKSKFLQTHWDQMRSSILKKSSRLGV